MSRQLKQPVMVGDVVMMCAAIAFAGIALFLALAQHTVSAPLAGYSEAVPTDIVVCKALADRAHVRVTNGMSVEAGARLILRALAEHGLRAPRLQADGNQIAFIDGKYRRVQVYRVTQSDLQKAVDEVKPCFPAQ